MKTLFVLITLFILLIQTTAVSAQETLPDAGTLPDSPFYGAKKIFERISTALTFGDEALMQRNIDLAEIRLAEAIAMSERGKSTGNLMAEYNTRIAEANRLGNLKQGEVRERMLERMANATNRHLAIMERVRQQVPEQARRGIDRAIEISSVRNQQIFENLELELPGQSSNLILSSVEETANGFVEMSPYQEPTNWSNMRDSLIVNIDRQITVLENLKEKANNEQSKESIQRAIDRLKEWKEKLFDMETPEANTPQLRPTPTITRLPRPVPTFTIPPRPTPPIFEMGNVLTIGAAWNAETPTTVNIKVTAAGIPAESVNIKIDGIDAGITDSNGELSYTFSGLGTYTVLASKIGYNDATVTLTLMQGGISISAHASASMHAGA